MRNGLILLVMEKTDAMAKGRPEKVEENKFRAKVDKMGGEAIKLSTQGMYGKRGFNDRCVFMYPGVVVLFEFKRQGEKARKLQSYRHRKFKKMQIPCYVVFSCKKAVEILKKHIKRAKRIEAIYLKYAEEEDETPTTRI